MVSSDEYEVEKNWKRLANKIRQYELGFDRGSLVKTERSFLSRLSYRVAAAVVLLVLYGAVWWWISSNSQTYTGKTEAWSFQRYEVDQGQPASLFTLPDGSQVWLNSASNRPEHLIKFLQNRKLHP